MRKRKEIPEKHKKRLYDAVLETFSVQDFHQVDMRTVAENSGVSIATIYNYFQSKEMLLFAIITEYLHKLVALVDLHIRGLKSSKEIFRKLLWVTMDFYDRHPGVAITIFITVPTRSWMQQDAYRIGNRQLDQVFEVMQKQGDIDSSIDARRFKDIYYMFCYRVIQTWYFYGVKWKLVDALDEDFELIWKLLAKERVIAKTE
jgi:AcrR family transcriptional regulator